MCTLVTGLSSGGADLPPPNSCYVVVDPSLASKDDVAEAVRWWNASLPEMTLILLERSHCRRGPRTFCLSKSDHDSLADMGCSHPAHVACTRKYADNGALIKVDFDHFDRSDWRKVVAHEIGHALGLPHGSDYSLMAEQIANEPDEVTQEDIQAFWKVRGADAGL